MYGINVRFADVPAGKSCLFVEAIVHVLPVATNGRQILAVKVDNHQSICKQ